MTTLPQKGKKRAKTSKEELVLWCLTCVLVARKSRPRLARVDGFGELLGLASEPTEPTSTS
jgi:hypothetical protein